MSLGFAVSPVVLDLLVSKFDKTGGKNKAIEYDNFIEYVFYNNRFTYPLRILLFFLKISSLTFIFYGFRCCLTVKVWIELGLWEKISSLWIWFSILAKFKLWSVIYLMCFMVIAGANGKVQGEGHIVLGVCYVLVWNVHVDRFALSRCLGFVSTITFNVDLFLWIVFAFWLFNFACLLLVPEWYTCTNCVCFLMFIVLLSWCFLL